MRILAVILCLIAPLRAGTEIITLGDSLTFAYEAEFCFEYNIPGGETYGDGFDASEVKNWVEILDQNRNEDFDLGGRMSAEIPFETPFGTFTLELYLRQERNWAIPGLKINQLQRFLTSGVGFVELLTENPEFEEFADLAEMAEIDFAVQDLEDQIRTSEGRVVLFIGGNDVRSIYDDVYEGASVEPFRENFLNDAAAILDRVRELNAGIPIVVVNVPQIGITPQIKDGYPFDPMKTRRVTTFLRELNDDLAELARSRGAAVADIFTSTLPLLTDDPLSVYGVPFTNAGSVEGRLDFVWLNGEYSANFHPNTNAQALIANEIVGAFNREFDANIPALTASEVLVDLLQRSPSEVDMNFANWAESYSLSGLTVGDDDDGDGWPAEVEFALGLNPLLADSEAVSSGVFAEFFELAYPVRLPESSFVEVVPTTSDNLEQSFQPLEPTPQREEDGLFHARLSLSQSKGFLRLETR
jgi:lysophospholipase L1-like esterase